MARRLDALAQYKEFAVFYHGISLRMNAVRHLTVLVNTFTVNIMYTFLLTHEKQSNI